MKTIGPNDDSTEEFVSTLQGVGILENENDSSLRWDVEYKFQVNCESFGEAILNGKGVVKATPRVFLAEGRYVLFINCDDSMLVENVGSGVWKIPDRREGS